MKLPRIPLPPTVRKLIAAGAVLAGVFTVGHQLKGNVPRDTEVSLSLRAYDDASKPVRAVEVTFLRGDAPLRGFRREFSAAAPRTLTETLSLPEGPLRAHVTVVVGAVAVERDAWVTVAADAPLELPMPSPP